LKKRPPSQVESEEPVVPPISVRNVSKGYDKSTVWVAECSRSL